MDNAMNTRKEGFYWDALGQNPPEIAYWERGDGGCAVKIDPGNRRL